MASTAANSSLALRNVGQGRAVSLCEGCAPNYDEEYADYGRIRVMADRLRVESIDREGRTVVIKFRPQARLDPARLVNLVRQRSGKRIG